MHRYIIVLSIRDKKVNIIIESEPVDADNVWDISVALSASWLEISAKYPSPKYDVIWGAWDSVGAVQDTVGRYWNWESASCEPLPVAP